MNILQEYIKTFIIFEAKSFLDKEHDWDEVLIDNDKHTFMRKQIKDYYIKNIDKIFPFEQIKEAFKYQEEIHPRGKIVIKIK